MHWLCTIKPLFGRIMFLLPCLHENHESQYFYHNMHYCDQEYYNRLLLWCNAIIGVNHMFCACMLNSAAHKYPKNGHGLGRTIKFYTESNFHGNGGYHAHYTLYNDAHFVITNSYSACKYNVIIIINLLWSILITTRWNTTQMCARWCAVDMMLCNFVGFDICMSWHKGEHRQPCDSNRFLTMHYYSCWT